MFDRTSTESYKDLWYKAPVRIMYLVREMQNLAYSDPWMDQKQAPMISPSGADNTRWVNMAIFMILDEDSIIKSTCMVKSPLEFWG